MNPSALTTALADRYSIERELGRGGMATVFLAKDLRHHRAVAIKVLDPELGAVIGVDRFLSEIRVTANLQHPNLLPLFDSGSADGMLFYVMPYVEGETLRARLDREKQLPVEEAVRIALAIANALDYAHAHGVVHRDLKPENILLQHGEPVVADFGIALAVSNAGGSRVTQTGISLGTPQYMSPEQAMGDRAVDRRSDIYSLAALLYEMLAGEPPHSGTSGQAIIAKLMTEEPVRLSNHRRTVSPQIEAAVHRGLEKLPADRWNTVKEFADALRAGPGANATAFKFRDTGHRKLSAWVPYGIAAVAIVIALAAIVSRRTAPAIDETTLRFLFVTRDSELLPSALGVPFAFSPDGRRLAYIGTAGPDTRIYLRGLDDMQTRALGQPGYFLSPVVSPDGKWVAMALPERVVKASTDGAAAMTTVRPLSGETVAGMSWVDPDTIIASVGGRLEAVPVDGGAPVVLARPDTAHGELLQWGPRVMDKRFVAFVAVGAAGIASNHLAILDRRTGRTTRTPHPAPTVLGVVEHHLIWVTTTGTAMAAAVDGSGNIGTPKRVLEDVLVRPGGAAKAALSASGTLIYQRGVAVSQLMSIDAATGTRTPLGPDARAYAHPRYSPDGSRIAVAIARTGGSDIWLMDVRTKALTKLTSGTGSDDQPAWSSDGKRVLYWSLDGSGAKVKWIAADNSERDGTALATGADPYAAALSHDGKWIVYRTGEFSAAARAIFRVPVTGGTPQLLLSTPASNITPTTSPDDRWLVYTTDGSGALEVYVRPFDSTPSAASVRISANGGSEPTWSRDGRSIYYRQGNAMMEATLTGGATPSVGNTRKLFDGAFLIDPGNPQYDVAPDGKHFLMLESANRQAETIVIYNWIAELRRAWK